MRRIQMKENKAWNKKFLKQCIEYITYNEKHRILKKINCVEYNAGHILYGLQCTEYNAINIIYII